MIDRKAFRFFHQHAGGVVGQHAITAAALAKAETWINEHGDVFTLVEEPDWNPDLGDHDYWCGRTDCEHEVFVFSIQDDEGNVYACVGGVIDPDNDYSRVVFAELASEVMADFS